MSDESRDLSISYTILLSELWEPLNELNERTRGRRSKVLRSVEERRPYIEVESSPDAGYYPSGAAMR